MKELPVAGGYNVLVDDEDFDRLSAFKWSMNDKRANSLYPIRRVSGKKIWLHKEVIGAQTGEEVDHKNHNTLDCRRDNLRRATRGQNMANTRLRRDNTSGFKGVSYEKVRGKFSAIVSYQGRNRHLGYFSTAELADEAARAGRAHFHGAFANHGADQ